MPCDNPAHDHVWSANNPDQRLTIQRCEHYCSYCDNGHYWKCAAALRRHVATKHCKEGKTHPTVWMNPWWKEGTPPTSPPQGKKPARRTTGLAVTQQTDSGAQEEVSKTASGENDGSDMNVNEGANPGNKNRQLPTCPDCVCYLEDDVGDAANNAAATKIVDLRSAPNDEASTFAESHGCRDGDEGEALNDVKTEDAVSVKMEEGAEDDEMEEASVSIKMENGSVEIKMEDEGDQTQPTVTHHESAVDVKMEDDDNQPPQTVISSNSSVMVDMRTSPGRGLSGLLNAAGRYAERNMAVVEGTFMMMPHTAARPDPRVNDNMRRKVMIMGPDGKFAEGAYRGHGE
ncbi:hypothetical protein K470DRAFT_288258 [Piedraia hortae CBS 480.64]|uniref:Uncharacterized protein n=1 Tax=Piedraia hortae CBS 480.64 TaxID=1314780 RepID=A0A6A7CA63_9PEZI|nr:hypothetical protein K470DRAFT_288258 [Piedraia hortae CBS 480.64]